ncbi:hypothetical protein VO54_01500 [Elizabethkingia miricola]|nr:hypothetical protein VO54_01500 [Elizabethkingia miricola]
MATKMTFKKTLLITGFSFVSILGMAQEKGINTIDPNQKMAAIGTAKTWGRVDGIALTSLVQGPGSATAPLQVACVFEYTEGDIFNSPPALPAAFNGLVHLDQSLKGELTEIRKTGKFLGHFLETFVLTPQKGTLKASKLLLIGLGNRNEFTSGEND